MRCIRGEGAKKIAPEAFAKRLFQGPVVDGRGQYPPITNLFLNKGLETFGQFVGQLTANNTTYGTRADGEDGAHDTFNRNEAGQAGCGYAG